MAVNEARGRACGEGVDVTATRRPLHAPGESAPAITQPFRIRADEGIVKYYATLSFYEDGKPGHLRFSRNATGGHNSGMEHGIGDALTELMQHGIPLRPVLKRYVATKFQPNGLTIGDKHLHTVSSPLDFLARWLLRELAERGIEPISEGEDY